jgi:ribosome biogenesis GTPase
MRTDARVIHVEIDGEVRPCTPRGKLFEERSLEIKSIVVVGDRVRLSRSGDVPGIEEVLPRRNSLSRVASVHDPREQVLFANVDQLFVIGSVANPGFSSGRTDRILAACRYSEIPARLVLNKIDLDRGHEREPLRATYEAAGVAVHEVSALEGVGIETIRALLGGKVSVFYGGSGVGKSTLLNALEPELALRTGKISKYWDAGKHTTSFSQMHHLPGAGGWAIDTPGVRVFRLHGINAAELRDLFPEFARYAGRCRYVNCSHDHEPECAVFEAVEHGELAPTRYASYVEILDELRPPEEDVETVVPEPNR